MRVAHASWLRQYAQGVQRAASTQSDRTLRAQMEETAERLLAAAMALTAEPESRLADYARADEVAERLGISLETARRLMRQGTLPAEKWGNVWVARWEELEAFAREYAWGAAAHGWVDGTSVEMDAPPVGRRKREAVSPLTVRGWMRVGPGGGG